MHENFGSCFLTPGVHPQKPTEVFYSNLLGLLTTVTRLHNTLEPYNKKHTYVTENVGGL